MMRNTLLAGAAMCLVAGPASADTLREALLKAYQTNPTLTAARADLRAVDENVPIARADGLPSVDVQGGYTQTLKSETNSFGAANRQLNAQANFSLPIYSGGAVRNSVAAAKTRVDAGRASLRGTESDLFTNVVGAYMNVIRDEAIVGLNQQNVHVLEVNLQATKDRFQVGDLTRTDVAQSEARLAQARSDLESAQANLITSREQYVQLVGTPPGVLEPPPELPGLPTNVSDAVTLALQDNPTLQAARKQRDATRYDVRVAGASRLPKLSLVAGGDYYNYLHSQQTTPGVSLAQSGSGATAGVSMTLPLFQGGRPGAEVRQAQARESEAIEQTTEAERAVVAQTRSAYASWQSSLQVIKSSKVAVDANQLSLQGVRAENSVGNRTILDILNAEQELLNSQVTLVSAQRDAYVAGFALLAAMGEAEAKDLGLGGGALYNPVANYNRVHHKIWDFDSDPTPQAVATSTADVPAQGAEVNPSAVPQLDTPVDNRASNPAGDVKTDR